MIRPVFDRVAGRVHEARLHEFRPAHPASERPTTLATRDVFETRDTAASHEASRPFRHMQKESF